MDESGHDGLPAEIRVDTPHEPNVDLEEVGPQLREVVEVRDTGARVVDGESNVGAETQDRRMQRGVVGDGFVLGDLQDHWPTPRRKGPPEQGGVAGERRGDIE